MSKIWLGILFFFSMVDTNLHINLFIKPALHSALSKKGSIVLIVCLQQKQPNQNLLSARIS